ncbi:MAG: DsbA family protein [Halobacteriales archaeon]
MGRIEEKKQERKKKDKEDSDLGSILAVVGIVAIVGVLLWFVVSGGGAATADPWEGVTVLEDEDHPTVVAEDASEEDAEEMVEVVYYTDYGCPHCATFDENYKDEFLEDHVASGDVKLVVRSVDMTDSEGTEDALNAGMAHYAAWEVSAENWPQFSSTVFRNQAGNPGWASPASLEGFAGEIDGLDGSELREIVESGEYESQVGDNVREFESAGVGGTPGFVVDGDETFSGMDDSIYDDLSEAIEEAGDDGSEGGDEPTPDEGGNETSGETDNDTDAE